ncbi:MAG: preprotein translocase subunit YajC [Clostridiaceae bacterium]|jgi:preprotein translocase subunit YajC|nr:preprotein translocase subunit YajC [Clostridiales bacterium]MDD4139114.1 preprotein translocase subunit YajC [Eubacteriales bacterium]MDD4743176.1 preprotein translocase subunit YajC [Eubacteriales bacterium]NLB44861.1 preprotein translocase subunit YajC [Clostridiaceae bacterium]
MLYPLALTDVAPAGGIESILGLVLPLALMFGLMYLLLIRPQKKKEKKLREQINSMIVGDNVVTIGGIVGRVVNLKDDEVTISTSVANTLITFKKSSINTVVKPLSD